MSTVLKKYKEAAHTQKILLFCHPGSGAFFFFFLQWSLDINALF